MENKVKQAPINNMKNKEAINLSPIPQFIFLSRLNAVLAQSPTLVYNEKDGHRMN
jgi:hypothetical protein